MKKFICYEVDGADTPYALGINSNKNISFPLQGW